MLLHHYLIIALFDIIINFNLLFKFLIIEKYLMSKKDNKKLFFLIMF